MTWEFIFITTIIISFIFFLDHRRNKAVENWKNNKKRSSKKLGEGDPGKLVCEDCGQNNIHNRQKRCTNINCGGKMIDKN